jgi:hypothetical protein
MATHIYKHSFLISHYEVDSQWLVVEVVLSCSLLNFHQIELVLL